MAPRAHMSSGRVSQGLLLLWVLLGAGLYQTDSVTTTTSFSQDAGTSPPMVMSNRTAQLMVLELLRRPDEECDDIGVVRVESHQQALQRAAGLPGVLGRAPELQLPQCPGRAVHLPEPLPLLPQLHPGASGVLRPARRCAPGHDHRPHLPHPLPRHPGHLAQQGRQGASLELPSRPASGHGPPAAGPPDHPNRPVGSRGHQPALLRRPVLPAPSPPCGPGLNVSPSTPGAGSSAARSLHGPGPGHLPPPAPS
ncbi:receptor activity-modifying protein 2 isoform X2 [Parus major]|uniref:receptor activity-modifying protein 2 isoform X2 n=1 Tax=Parus major TaxID=9157 RepID=UPI000771545E|nr:receptor activity-modifying protein 2 isoform X2 [Parus major]